MTHIYQSMSAKVIKIGIINKKAATMSTTEVVGGVVSGAAPGATSGSTTESNLFESFFNNHILSIVKLCKNFTIKIDQINDISQPLTSYNFIFYVTDLSDLTNDNLDQIKKVVAGFTDPLNHLFIIVDNCYNLTIDDDDDLIFDNENDNDIYENFDQKLSQMIPDNIYHMLKISVCFADIWKIIANDNSIVNLTDSQVELLASKLIKKSKLSKLSLSDIKKEVRIIVKKIMIDDKLAECGYSHLIENVSQYFKLPYQKKIVCQNYLTAFNNIKISLDGQDIDNINTLLKEIYGISYMKTDMHDKLTDNIDLILSSKLKIFYDQLKNRVSIVTTSVTSGVASGATKSNIIDAHAYHDFLTTVIDIGKGYNLSAITEITKIEIDKINNFIIDYHKSQFEKITDLEKITSLLEIFSNKDRLNFTNLFEKIRTNIKIMQENINKMDKWVMFVNRCLKFGIGRDACIKLIETIIMEKISAYGAITNNKDMSIIYPQCLQIFLISNLSKHFVFKKLYMYLSYSIRYSGKNILDLIKNLKSDQYQSMLILENRLLQLCSVQNDENSQPINPNDVNIAEIYNEETIIAKKLSK